MQVPGEGKFEGSYNQQLSEAVGKLGNKDKLSWNPETGSFEVKKRGRFGKSGKSKKFEETVEKLFSTLKDQMDKGEMDEAYKLYNQIKTSHWGQEMFSKNELFKEQAGKFTKYRELLVKKKARSGREREKNVRIWQDNVNDLSHMIGKNAFSEYADRLELVNEQYDPNGSGHEFIFYKFAEGSLSMFPLLFIIYQKENNEDELLGLDDRTMKILLPKAKAFFEEAVEHYRANNKHDKAGEYEGLLAKINDKLARLPRKPLPAIPQAEDAPEKKEVADDKMPQSVIDELAALLSKRGKIG